jgi:hypothetical protein
MINLCPSVDVPYITNLLLVIDQFARKMSNSSFCVSGCLEAKNCQVFYNFGRTALQLFRKKVGFHRY